MEKDWRGTKGLKGVCVTTKQYTHFELNILNII